MNTKPFVAVLFVASAIFLATSMARPTPRKAGEYFGYLNASDPTVQEDGRFAISEYNKKASAASHLEFIQVVNASEVGVSEYAANYHLLITNLKLEAKNCSQAYQSAAGLYFAQLYAENQTPRFLSIFEMSDNTRI